MDTMNKALTAQSPCDRKVCLLRLPHEGILASIGRALRKFGSEIVEFHRMRRSFEELAAMNDCELEDIGINRTDISAVFAGTYQRQKSAPSNVIALNRCHKLRSSGCRT